MSSLRWIKNDIAESSYHHYAHYYFSTFIHNNIRVHICVKILTARRIVYFSVFFLLAAVVIIVGGVVWWWWCKLNLCVFFIFCNACVSAKEKMSLTLNKMLAKDIDLASTPLNVLLSSSTPSASRFFFFVWAKLFYPFNIFTTALLHIT